MFDERTELIYKKANRLIWKFDWINNNFSNTYYHCATNKTYIKGICFLQTRAIRERW